MGKIRDVPIDYNESLRREQNSFLTTNSSRSSKPFIVNTAIIVSAIMAVLLFLCPAKLRAYTTYEDGATISGSTTWSAGETFLIQGSCTVTSGAVLTISQGVTVKFDTGADLTIEGTLNASGTSGAQIYFTSANDNTAGETITGSSGEPAPGDWDYVRFDAASSDPGSGNLSYCNFRYG